LADLSIRIQFISTHGIFHTVPYENLFAVHCEIFIAWAFHDTVYMLYRAYGKISTGANTLCTTILGMPDNLGD